MTDIDIEKQDGYFRLALLEVLERFYDYLIVDGTAYFLLKKEHIVEFGLERYPDIERTFFELIAGYDETVVVVRNFQKTFDSLIGYTLAKIEIDSLFSHYDKEYDRTTGGGKCGVR